MDSSATIKRLQSGGVDELTQWFIRLRPHIRRLVDARLDQRLHARVDASDIVQETFVRASQGLDAYLKSPKMAPLTWIRLISKHLIAEAHRHHFRPKRSPAREQKCADESGDLLISRIADSVDSIGAAMDHQELVGRVRLAMEKLNDNDREIIEMRHIDGLSIQDAANCLEISFEAAKKRYHRALVRFREITTELS